MRAGRQPLEVRDKLPWVEVKIRDRRGVPCKEWLILDTGTSHTILSVDLAEALGFPESEGAGEATFDTPDGPVLGYTVRVPGLIFAGREIKNYLLGCKAFHVKLHVPGILGFDFFAQTDLLISPRKMSVHLAW
jgi:hypothetical protein